MELVGPVGPTDPYPYPSPSSLPPFWGLGRLGRFGSLGLELQGKPSLDHDWSTYLEDHFSRIS